MFRHRETVTSCLFRLTCSNHDGASSHHRKRHRKLWKTPVGRCMSSQCRLVLWRALVNNGLPLRMSLLARLPPRMLQQAGPFEFLLPGSPFLLFWSVSSLVLPPCHLLHLSVVCSPALSLFLGVSCFPSVYLYPCVSSVPLSCIVYVTLLLFSLFLFSGFCF